MLSTTVLILLASVPTLSQNLAKPDYLKKFPSLIQNLAKSDYLKKRHLGSQPRSPPASAFAPTYADSYNAKMMDRPQLETSRNLPHHYYDARAIAPGLKEHVAQKAAETIFTPRAPPSPETDISGRGSGFGKFAPSYASSYAPAFSSSAKTFEKGVSAQVSAWTAPAGIPQEVAPKANIYSKPLSGGASGFAPSYAAAYAPAFGSAAKGSEDYQALESSFAAPAYISQDVAARANTYSKPSSGGASGFAPSYAAAYAPAFGSAAKGSQDYQSSPFTAPAHIQQEGAVRANTYSKPSSGGASGFAPSYAAAYAPAFGSAAKGSQDYQSSSFTAPAHIPQEGAARANTYSEPSSGGASGFAPLFAPAYASAFFGSRHTEGHSASLSKDILQSPTSAFNGGSAPAPSSFSASPKKEALSRASGFAPLFAPAYAPALMNLDATKASLNVMGTIAVTLMCLSISFGGVIFVVKRFRRRALTLFEEPLTTSIDQI